MLDIVEINDGEDMVIRDAIVSKAGNVLSIQIGDLEYLPDFGIDFKYFLESDLQFQNESFKAYCVQRLVESQVNVSQVIETVETFLHRFTYVVGDTKPTSTGGFII